MREEQRSEIIEYNKLETDFYDWKTERYTIAGGYDFFKDYLKSFLEPDYRVLDIGCGNGKTLSRISNQIKKGYGIEIDENRYEMAVKNNKNNENIKIIKQSAYEPFEIKEKFDLIFSERGPVNQKNIGNIKKALKPGGILLIEMIGRQNKRFFKTLMGKGQGYGKWGGKSTRTEIKEMLESNGFRNIRIDDKFYLTFYPNIVELTKNHIALPYFDFVIEEDLKKLEEVEERLKTERGIKLLGHKVVYSAVK